MKWGGAREEKQNVVRYWKDGSQGSNERLHRLEEVRGMKNSGPPLFLNYLLLSILNIIILTLFYSWIITMVFLLVGVPPFSVGSH